MSSDIGWLDEQTGHKFMIMGAWYMIYNKGRAKYKQDESNDIGWLPIQ